jgi:16S rRNA (cytidine1402-2'-O)-methyltransferase
MDQAMNKGTLYLIPSTLGDTPPAVTLPAATIDILRMLSHFIAEEASTARRFLRNAGFAADYNATTLLVFNEHSDRNDLMTYLEPAMRGEDIGLLSEAGVPCVADPGFEIVELAHQLGIRVRPLTGPSSIILALMASGFNGQNFVFHGYLPIERTQRARKIKEIEKEAREKQQTQIFIETPYRNRQMLAALAETCSRQTRICLAVDLTLGSEKIEVRTAAEWKGDHPEIHKRPAVFLLSV